MRGLIPAAVAAAGMTAAGVPGAVAPSTREMAALLRERAAQVDAGALPYVVNERRAELLSARLQQAQTLAERLALRFDYAKELINAGRNEDALRVIADLKRDAEAINPDAYHRRPSLLLGLEAVAWMRIGEQQNCSADHNRNSCLLPIRRLGVHRQAEGSTRAVEVLTDLLAAEPGNLRARWLLNIAQMTLGGYPDKVPAGLLVPPSAFASEYTLPRFEDVANEAGVDVFGLSGGAILDDFDGDGALDLMLSAIGFEDQLRLFRGDGAGHFRERTAEAGLSGETGGLNLLQADYDNDGRLDALVLRGGWMGSQGRFPLSLLRNRGDGTFEDVTRAAGLLRFAPTQTATWLDYDGDGWLDLFVGNESDPDGVHPCQLFHGSREGTFTEVAAQVGADVVGFVKGVVSGDYNGDGRPDLYVSIVGADNVLLRNDGPAAGAGWRFTNVAAEAGVTAPRDSFPAAFFDYDNDGRLDLFVASYRAMAEDVAADLLGLPTEAERPRLYRNRGDGAFEDVTRAAGLYRVFPAMGLNFGDLDNDGWLDLYVGTGNPDLSTLVPNRLFRNAEGRVFQDVTTAVDVGHLQKGHAICFGDVDGDGDQDIFEQMGGAVSSDRAFSALYRNPGAGAGNQWIGLELVGVRSNRSAIGARIKVTARDGNGTRLLYRTVGSGGSFGASPLRQHIGLGRATRVASVEVTWPATGRTQVLGGLEPGRWYRVREDASRPQELKSATGGRQ